MRCGWFASENELAWYDKKDDQIECRLNTGYVVQFSEDNDADDSAEFFIPNSDIAMDSHVFNDENSQPLNNYEVAMG